VPAAKSAPRTEDGQHVHIWLEPSPAGTHDAGGRSDEMIGMAPTRRNGEGDQGGGEPGPGYGPLLARIRQNGQTGDWEGEAVDEDGNAASPLIIRSDPNGNGLLIHHAPVEAGDAAPSGKLGLFNPVGSHEPTGSKKPPMAAPGLTGDAYDQAMLKAFKRDGMARGGPGAEIAANRAYAKQVAEAFRGKR
jgi:hypothetical protein